MPDEQTSEPIPAKADESSSTSESVGSESSSNEETIDASVEAKTQGSNGSSKPVVVETESEAITTGGSKPDADAVSSELESSKKSDVETDSPPIEVVISEKVELTEEQVKELLAQLNDKTPGPDAPTESYTHPVTGREVYVPKSKELGSAAAISTMALLMFVGGGLATLMMVARAFDLHGDTLVAFVIGSCALILGMAGGLLLKTLGDKWWVGAVVGACFGVIGGILIYAQTSHHAWWH